jgi:hypothetical protein
MSVNTEAFVGFLAAIALLGMVVFFGWIFGLAGVSAITQSACLERGYAESNVDWKFNRYCIQRDYTGFMKSIPLDEAKDQP